MPAQLGTSAQSSSPKLTTHIAQSNSRGAQQREPELSKTQNRQSSPTWKGKKNIPSRFHFALELVYFEFVELTST